MNELSDMNYNFIMDKIKDGRYSGVDTVPVVTVAMSLSEEDDGRDENQPSHLCNIPVNLN